MANVSDLKISNVKDSLIKELTIISHNLGQTKSGFIKIKLKEIADSYPDDIKTKKKD